MIIQTHHTDRYHLLGGKASALAKLSETGANIPAWFAVTELNPNTDQILDLADTLQAEYFAVRSSAQEEDGAEHSFAGQFDSFLYVEKSRIIEKIEAVFNSSNSDHLDTYKGSKSITPSDSNSITALVQKMITPDVSGVAFSADPVSGDRSKTIISALWGTGSALVSGEADADTWTLQEDQIIDKKIATKTQQHTSCKLSNEGVKTTKVHIKKQTIPCLTDHQIKQVVKLAEQCQEHFKSPQDIEWAFENGVLYLLQSRPITTLKTYTSDAASTVWDNSNIAESYSGITSPLTFSFAKRIYEHVYREFCLLLSVPKGRVKKHDAVFPEMLGHIHGHVYYNLNSWYHVLAMLPGFSLNRNFMEQMMGVKVPMPTEIIEQIVEKTKTNKFYDGLTLARTMVGLVRNQIGLNKSIDKFYQRLETALNSNKSALSEMTSTELIEHYAELESKLLKRWDAPLVNDFFAMIHYGVLKSLCEKWIGDDTLHNKLLLDCGEIVSAEPPKRILEMAEIVRDDNKLLDTLDDPNIPSKEKQQTIQNHPALNEALSAYLEKFGDRCLEELKLESPSVGDNPQSLFSSITAMARRPIRERIPEVADSHEDVVNQLSWFKRKIFRWVLKNAKARVRDRENLRFERTRLFGRVRKIVLEIGKRLQEKGRLAEYRDIFFLTLEEAMSEKNDDYKILVTTRKNEQNKFRNQSPPPDRFHTIDPIEEYDSFLSALPYTPPDGHNISGTGACPGLVRGPVRVVLDPRQATLKEGEILVAQQTDPGWVVLFPAASGLLVERGSLLSHSAIVARELGLPCVVSVPDITKTVKTGDLVEMNGSTGTITIIKEIKDED